MAALKGAQTSVASPIRCRRLRAAIGAQRKAHRLPIPSVLASDATPRCASMASADRQMPGDATLGALAQGLVQAYAAGHRDVQALHRALHRDARQFVAGLAGEL